VPAEFAGHPGGGTARAGASRPAAAPRAAATATLAQLRRELDDAREQLAASEETLRAIRCGEVDAVMVAAVAGGHERVFSLASADERRAEAELARSAHCDVLTGLANRALLTDRIQHALDRRAAGGTVMALLFCDLDEFKDINDAYGHEAGDAVLRAVAARLTSAVRPEDTVARLGGDEFVVLCEDLTDVHDAAAVAGRIRGAVCAPLVTDSVELEVCVSIGVAVVHPDAVADPASLLRDADEAMYKAKQQGPNIIELFDEQLRAAAAAKLRLLSQLRQAVPDGQLRLHYQPVLRLDDETVIGMEALVRWHHPDRGLVRPDDFIPVAERSGLITEIGAWVLREACRQAATWRAAPQRPAPQQAGRSPADGDGQPLHMSVNVSGRQLAQGTGLIHAVSRALQESGLDPTALVLEVTETALMEDAEDALRVVNELKSLGVRVAIDDFGTGYSSLLYLKRFPVDLLKVDRSFVAGLGDSPDDAAIVRSVIELAHAFGIAAVAEGVENHQHLAMLRDFGCTYGQGYLWSPARPAADLGPQLFTSTSSRRWGAFLEGAQRLLPLPPAAGAELG